MEIHVIRTGVFRVNTIIVSAEKHCFVVDPAACELAGDQNVIVDYLNKKKLVCDAVVLTHSHFDHITGVHIIKKAFPKAKVAIHQAEAGELQNAPGPMGESVIRFFGALELLDAVSKQPCADIFLKEGQNLSVLNKELPFYSEWEVLHTPGHTPGSICLYNKSEKILISGDTLFAYGGYGRTDMSGGSENEIIHSLSRLKDIVSADTKVYPGHDEFGFTFG